MVAGQVVVRCVLGETNAIVRLLWGDEGVERATPYTSLTQFVFKSMTTTNHTHSGFIAEDQILS